MFRSATNCIDNDDDDDDTSDLMAILFYILLLLASVCPSVRLSACRRFGHFEASRWKELREMVGTDELAEAFERERTPSTSFERACAARTQSYAARIVNGRASNWRADNKFPCANRSGSGGSAG